MAETPIPADHVRNVCAIGRGAATCSFVAFNGQFICAKGTAMESVILRRRAVGTLGAQGDNCSGPPDFAAQLAPTPEAPDDE